MNISTPRKRVRKVAAAVAGLAAAASIGLVPASSASAISTYPGSCTGQWACLSSTARSGGSTTTGSDIYGWNYTSGESHVAFNTGGVQYPNGLYIGSNARSVRNRNGGTARSVFVYTGGGLTGSCRERPYDSITWRVSPLSPNGNSITVAPLNSRACTNF